MTRALSSALALFSSFSPRPAAVAEAARAPRATQGRLVLRAQSDQLVLYYGLDRQ
jgi:hypothetical protein